MFYRDAKQILSAQNGMNPYRGCTHGCIYCDTRSACYQFDHPLEDVEIKGNAPRLLEEALSRKRQRCMIGTGAMSDPYQPIEETERLTRRCLEVIDRYDFGFTVITKSERVLRDLDLFTRIQSRTKCVVQMTLTCMDEELSRILEPNVCTTVQRIEVLRTLRAHGIPTVVWLSPLLPFLTDTEENLRGILNACFETGVRGVLNFGIGLTLRQGNREYFYANLKRHFPGLMERYIQRFGNRYVCNSPNHHRLMRIFHAECERHGVMHRSEQIFAYLAAFEDKLAAAQISLFDERIEG